MAKPGRPRRKTKWINDVLHYRCGLCTEFKPAEAFYPDMNRVDRLTNRCRKCGIKSAAAAQKKANAISRLINAEDRLLRGMK